MKKFALFFATLATTFIGCTKKGTDVVTPVIDVAHTSTYIIDSIMPMVVHNIDLTHINPKFLSIYTNSGKQEVWVSNSWYSIGGSLFRIDLPTLPNSIYYLYGSSDTASNELDKVNINWLEIVDGDTISNTFH